MKWLLLSLAFTLLGCATIGSDVVPIGKGTYQMSMTGVGFATQANTNIKALKAANDYCNKMNKHMVPQHSAESGVYECRHARTAWSSCAWMRTTLRILGPKNSSA